MEPEFIQQFFKNKEIFTINEDDNILYKAVDVETVLQAINIRTLIQNFGEDERCLRNIQTTRGMKDVLFLTQKGLFRLLHNTKKDISKEFRQWTSIILKKYI